MGVTRVAEIVGDICQPTPPLRQDLERGPEPQLAPVLVQRAAGLAAKDPTEMVDRASQLPSQL